MPKYTARVHILKNKNFYEEIWFDGIHAKGQIQANNIAADQAHNYIQLQNANGNIYWGYNIILCVRTAVLDNKEKLAKAQAKSVRPLLALPFTKQTKTTPVNIIMNEKFKDEAKGDFKDPFVFAKDISISCVDLGRPYDWY